MKYLFSVLISFLTMAFACGQPAPADRPQLENPEFDKKLENLLRFSIPLIGVKELKNIQSEVHIFDTRKEEEYAVSHIPGATFLGYDSFDPKQLAEIPKTDTVVLYCSVGYRSEKIGERLRKMGYTNVLNLYGSLFEWTNAGYPLVDKNGDPTQKVHTYNKNWSKWVDDRKAEKIW